MRRALNLGCLVLGVVLCQALLSLPAPAVGQSAGYGIVNVIVLPTSAPKAFDIGWVDAASHRYYIAVNTHAAVDIFDTTSDSYVGSIGGFVGFHATPARTSGPTGVLVIPELNQLWAGDGDSTVKVADLSTNTIIATVSTGGQKRADELAYDPADHLVLIANDAEDQLFVTLISTVDQTVSARILVPDATDGLEQPVWDPASGLFYLTVPKTKTNAGGEVDVIDPKTMSIAKVFPLTNCNPTGNALGPNRHLALGCTGDPRNTQIMDDTNGSIVAIISQVGGSDELWYNPTDSHYYVAASGMTSDGTSKGTLTPVVGIIDADSNQWIQNVATIPGAHSVAVDPTTNHIYVPMANVGIAVYSAAAAPGQ